MTTTHTSVTPASLTQPALTQTFLTRTRPARTLALLLGTLACCAARPAHADYSISPAMPNSPTFISGNISGNLTISNPKHLPGTPVVITSTAKISGNVTVHDDSLVYVSGQVSGDLNTCDASQTTVFASLGGKLNAYDSSSVTVQKCSLGGLRTYGNSSVTVNNNDQSKSAFVISIGSVESYGFSQIRTWGLHASSPVEGASTCSITASSVFAHQYSFSLLEQVDISQGAQADGLGYLVVTAVVPSITARDRSRIDVVGAYCTGTVAQYQSSKIHDLGSTLLGSVIAWGWPGGGIPTNTPLHYTQGGIYLDGAYSAITANISALGGFINILGGKVHCNKLYGQAPAPDPNGGYLHSVVVTGNDLTFTNLPNAKILTGGLGVQPTNGSSIWAICSGTVELGDEIPF